MNSHKRIERYDFHVMLLAIVMLAFVIGIKSVDAQEAPEEMAGPVVGDTFRDCAGCPELVVVPAGTFNMGLNVAEESREDDEGPVHQVTVSVPFAVGKYEVTFSEWDVCAAAGCLLHTSLIRT